RHELASLPTRRSSDLEASRGQAGGRAQGLREGREIQGHRGGAGALCEGQGVAGAACAHPSPPPEGREQSPSRQPLIQEFIMEDIDRKSTRLNSSHVKI